VIKIVISVVACAVLLGAAAGAVYLIYANEPVAKQEGATRRSAALVETVVVEHGSYRPQIVVLGTVQPAEEVDLSPRVGGRVITLQDAFEPGGIVEQGQPLLKIDPVDYQQVLKIRKSELAQMQAQLDIEMGRQAVAKQEFELLGEEIDPENRSLVLREPQIASIRAQLDAAQAEVDQAQLDVDRTTIAAPFDAQIITRAVNVGSEVSPGDRLAHLVGIDEYWVMASVPLRDLTWLRFDDDDERSTGGAAVRIRHTSAWPAGTHRAGRLARQVGGVDPDTRMASVLITVPDPLARNTDLPRMVLGTIVEVRITAEPIDDVVRLPRSLLRQNDTVWVMTDDRKLSIRKPTIVYRDSEYAYVSQGIEDGEHVVSTSLSAVTEGLELRRAETPADGDAASDQGPATPEQATPEQGGAS
jgi:RND family efflux transporter MFP subunit